jgi:hypothetical protein
MCLPLQGYNLCYSTLVNANDVARLPADSYEKSPSGHVFVRSSHKKGLLPQILDELLAARKRGACTLSVCLYVLCENGKAKLTLNPRLSWYPCNVRHGCILAPKLVLVTILVNFQRNKTLLLLYCGLCNASSLCVLCFSQEGHGRRNGPHGQGGAERPTARPEGTRAL